MLDLYESKEFFEKLKSSGLDDETIKVILNKMWPSFGLFATEGLDCIDFYWLHRDDPKIPIEDIVWSTWIGKICMGGIGFILLLFYSQIRTMDK